MNLEDFIDRTKTMAKSIEIVIKAPTGEEELAINYLGYRDGKIIIYTTLKEHL